MFDKIVLRRSEQGLPITAGELAEALLFYQSVHLVLDLGSLGSMLEKLSPAELLDVLKRPGVKAIWCDDVVGTSHVREGSIDYFGLAAITVSGNADGTKFNNYEDRIKMVLMRLGHSAGVASARAAQLRMSMSSRRLDGDIFIKGGVTKQVRNGLLLSTDHTDLVRIVVRERAPQLLDGKTLHWEVVDGDKNRLVVITNLEVGATNPLSEAMGKPPVSIASILTEILSAEADAILAGYYGADMYTSNLSSALMRARYSSLMRRAEIQKEEKEQYLELIFPEARAIREAIDSGNRSFKDFLAVLRKSDRFRKWLAGLGPDEHLAKEYVTSIHSEPWISSLPGKAIRLTAATLGGILSPAAGVALSAVDTFLVEKIAGGWRPNHFVGRELLPFVLPAPPGKGN